MRPWALIAGGGTAGHIVPALAVAHALVARGHSPESIHFVGSRFGMEREMVRAAGFDVTLLPGRGLTSRRANLTNAKAALALAVAAIRAVVLVARLRPAVVLSVGGFAAFPAGAAAVLLRIPLVLAESNAIPGATNRLLGRFARVSAVQFPGTGLRNERVVGNPVRPELLAVDTSEEGRRAARRRLGLPEDRVVVAAFGGSLGSRRINEAVLGFVAEHGDRSDLAIRHAVGRRDWPEVSNVLPSPAQLVYQPVEFEHDMPTMLAAADVAVTRAGGSTVTELTVLGRPAVLVPLPIAHRDHQTANARHLCDAGAAVLVPDSELTPTRLAAELDTIVSSGRLPEMARAARALARPGAADAIAGLLEENARG